LVAEPNSIAKLLHGGVRRDGVWHNLRTRIRKRWPQSEAWSVVEWGPRVGIHLHVIIRGVPDLDDAWVAHIVGLAEDGTTAHIQRVYGDPPVNTIRHLYQPDSTETLIVYLTKQLSNVALVGQWPRHFHPISVSRNWCPEWRARPWLDS
jgi:hypothetical protein